MLAPEKRRKEVIRLMRILLVNPPAGYSYGILGICRPPLGLAYIASLVRDKADVRIVDFNVEDGWKDFEYDHFDVVGISVDTSRCVTAFAIAKAAKAKRATVVMGGPHVSFLDQEALESGCCDYVVRNEGEYAFLSLIEHLAGNIPLEQVRGVSYREAGEIRRTPDAPFIQDLDSLPFPARDLLRLDLYKEKMNGRLMTTLVSSRGCPFNCEFCSASQFAGIKWRARSVESILSEIELLHDEYGYRAISFVDDNFTLNPERAIAVSEGIISKGWDIIWAAMSRVDSIVRVPHMIETMARAGFRWTFIGFESGSQEMLDGYGKKAYLHEALRAMEILKANRVMTTGAFILGAQNETADMVRQTIDFAKLLYPRRAQFSILTPYPGTRLFNDVEDRLLTRNWELYSGMFPTFKLDHLTPDETTHLFNVAYCAFYGRPHKMLENLSYIRRVSPLLFKRLGKMLGRLAARPVRSPIRHVKRYVVSLTRLLS
jgi:anaerobic magnesium-protoporphyrin IX monomethyl ester cyclase